MEVMYGAQIDSVNTQLLSSIDDSQTSFDVIDASVLPGTPTKLTIGYDKTITETILVTLITGNILTVQRGVEGIARIWDSGTNIARIFTAGDYNAMINNINEIADGGTIQFITTDKFTDINYVYFVGDVGSDWKVNRYDIDNVKTTSSGTIDKPTTLLDCQNLVYT